MTVRLVAALGQLVTTLVMLALPHVSRPDLLFGVPVPEGFRSTGAGRSAIRSYRLMIGIPAALSLLAALFLPNPAFAGAAVPALMVLGFAAFVAQNRKLKPFAIQPPQVRQTTLGPPEPLPGFTCLGILPLLLLAGAAMYLHSHWDQIPARYPVHFSYDGTPNRWVNRTVRGVYGPLLLGEELAVFLFGMALAGWYGSRRSESMRKPMLVVMIAVEWMIALLFGAIPLWFAGGIAIPIPALVLGPLVLLIPAMAYAIRESNKPRDSLDPTPNECWKGGIIYYNPNDAALFVQRRDGIGFTVNMANRWSWAIYGSLLLVVASMLVL
jgi:uncharacterized membrane protein